MVDWLNEYPPGSFRQSQVSFSSRLPKAVPLDDDYALSTHLALFNPFQILGLRHPLHLDAPHPPSAHSPHPSIPKNDADADADDDF